MATLLPGAGVVYSVLKDVWGWVSTRLRGRRLTPDVFRGWLVDEWYPLDAAIREFEDPAQLIDAGPLRTAWSWLKQTT